MDITFSKFFSLADDKPTPLKRAEPAISSVSKIDGNSKQVSGVVSQHGARKTPGENHMLSHRPEPKTEEPTIYPTAIDTTKQYRGPQAEKSTPVATIGPKIRFKGELVGEEDLLVQGKVEGTIDLKGHKLTVGEKGVLHANVSAKMVTIEGRVEGDVFGEECIAIRASSHVQGNIKAERVILEDGAKFRGSIDMDMDDRSDVKAMASKLNHSDAEKDKPKNPASPSENTNKS